MRKLIIIALLCSTFVSVPYCKAAESKEEPAKKEEKAPAPKAPTLAELQAQEQQLLMQLVGVRTVIQYLQMQEAEKAAKGKK